MSDILLIHEQPEQLTDLAAALEGQSISAELAFALPEREQLQRYECIVVLDSFVETGLAQLCESATILVISDNPTIHAAVSSIRQGAIDYLESSADTQSIVAAIELARTHSVVARHSNIDQFPMVGSSPAMQQLKAGIAKVAPTDSTVLITGQSGTGKELVARALHAGSTRAGAPLISINCATVPHNLIEAELFGLEQYDAATQSHRGLIEAAEGGTLFLDEIAELPSSAQARLLRVLQGENRKLGSADTAQANVRIIAATHRNLNELTRSGHFREDLFYRLNVVSFDIPPLSERHQDVQEIAEWLLQRTSVRLNKSALSFSADAEQAMQNYHWPGNVRELENAIERAVILSDNDTPISQTLLAIEPTKANAGAAERPTDPDQTSLEDYFVSFVLDNQDQYTETELAEKLGISRKSLWERRQRLNIPRRKTRKRGPRRDMSGP